MGEETFRDDDAAVVLAGVSPRANDVTDVVDHVLERLVTVLTLL